MLIAQIVPVASMLKGEVVPPLKVDMGIKAE